MGSGRKKKVKLGDQEVEGQIIPFRGDVEHWNEYLLDDGTVVRLKTIAKEIVRIDGQYDPEGNPVYAVISSNVIHTSSPDDLKGGFQQ